MEDICEDHWWGDVTEYKLDILPCLIIIWARSNPRYKITLTDSDLTSVSTSKVRPDHST